MAVWWHSEVSLMSGPCCCYRVSFFLVVVLICCFICKLSSRLGATMAPLPGGSGAVLPETTLSVGGRTQQDSGRKGWPDTSRT